MSPRLHRAVKGGAPRVAVVTATLDLTRAKACLASWLRHATNPLDLYIIMQGAQDSVGWNPQDLREGMVTVYNEPEILGVVPAFALGVQKALENGAEIICAFHDDLEIEQDGWDEQVVNLFQDHPQAGLCGFGGAKGLGSDDIYQTPYNPMQLARQGFRSNMRHAEAHGIRSEVAEQIACLDGFSQIGRREFWEGCYRLNGPLRRGEKCGQVTANNLFSQMQSWGVLHHFYDGMLGCFAKRLGWQVWYLPIQCHHHGGLTAVGDARYLQWANTQSDDPCVAGDQLFWIRSHQIGHTQFKAELPIRT